MSLVPGRFRLLTFDCYGTLIDWEQGILSTFRPLLDTHGVILSDEAVLERYARLEAAVEQEAYRSYREVLREVVVRLAREVGFTPAPHEQDVLSESLPGWPPFPDTVEALTELSSRYALGVISNVDDDLFAGTARTLGVSFRHVVTAQQARAYKPSPAVFEHALARTQVPRESILHVAQSLYHDIAPAGRLGITTVWVDRRRGKSGTGATPPAEATPDYTVSDLRELVALLSE